MTMSYYLRAVPSNRLASVIFFFFSFLLFTVIINTLNTKEGNLKIVIVSVIILFLPTARYYPLFVFIFYTLALHHVNTKQVRSTIYMYKYMVDMYSFQ